MVKPSEHDMSSRDTYGRASYWCELSLSERNDFIYDISKTCMRTIETARSLVLLTKRLQEDTRFSMIFGVVWFEQV